MSDFEVPPITLEDQADRKSNKSEHPYNQQLDYHKELVDSTPRPAESSEDADDVKLPDSDEDAEEKIDVWEEDSISGVR